MLRAIPFTPARRRAGQVAFPSQTSADTTNVPYTTDRTAAPQTNRKQTTNEPGTTNRPAWQSPLHTKRAGTFTAPALAEKYFY
ncbi:MAG: hypothetical protein EGP73_06945 [Alistipes indistinctus]|nr:hypothetical protein [Alistipes indistinctus]